MALFNSAHGGNIREAATVLGISPDQLLDFSANINPLGMPVSVKRALIDNLTALSATRTPIIFICTRRWRVIIRCRHRGYWREMARRSQSLPWRAVLNRVVQ